MVAPVRKITAPKILSDLVLWEEELAYSRAASGTVKATTVADIGTPLALDADHKVVPLPTDGSLVCIGFATMARAATTADATGGLDYIRRTAICKDFGIVWPTGISDANKAKALDEVEIRGVVVRASA